MAFKTPIAPGGRPATEEELKRHEEALETQRKEATRESAAEMRRRYGLGETQGFEPEEVEERRRYLAHLHKMYHSTGQGPMKEKIYQMIQEEQEAGLGPLSVEQGMVELANIPMETAMGVRSPEGKTLDIGRFGIGSGSGVPAQHLGVAPGGGGMGAIRRAKDK